MENENKKKVTSAREKWFRDTKMMQTATGTLMTKALDNLVKIAPTEFEDLEPIAKSNDFSKLSDLKNRIDDLKKEINELEKIEAEYENLLKENFIEIADETLKLNFELGKITDVELQKGIQDNQAKTDNLKRLSIKPNKDLDIKRRAYAILTDHYHIQRQRLEIESIINDVESLNTEISNFVNDTNTTSKVDVIRFVELCNNYKRVSEAYQNVKIRDIITDEAEELKSGVIDLLFQPSIDFTMFEYPINSLNWTLKQATPKTLRILRHSLKKLDKPL